MWAKRLLLFFAAVCIVVSADESTASTSAAAGESTTTANATGAGNQTTAGQNATTGAANETASSSSNATSMPANATANATASANATMATAPPGLCKNKIDGLYSWYELNQTMSAGNASAGNASAGNSSMAGASNMTSNITQEDMCEKYIVCSNGDGYILRCPNTLVFNPKKGLCQVKAVVDTPCGTLPPIKDAPPSCSGKKDNDTIKDFNDCRSYWTCNNSVAIKANCTSGMVYSEKNKTCVEQGKDTSGMCLPLSDPALAAFCKEHNNTGLHADPSTCTRGIVCLGDVHFFYTCTGWSNKTNNNAIGLFQFSNTTLSCVDKREEKCEPKPLPTTPATTASTPSSSAAAGGSSTTSGNLTTVARSRRHAAHPVQL